MKKNIGNVDMIVRLVLAALLVISYFLFNLKDLTGLIVIILAIILILTAFARVCPLYYLFGADTIKKKE